ncbi:MAG: sensor histidine kinase [Firmicutes bacterium]|uniref:histidine kinase n=1 Tax=Sulfobacillus benefaciens TaxID=453960 RepID=A0A2T2X2Z4_9FIRM|nr:sensor histidine kinase [Bacillota bacterium]MCL5014548.1 sensor histidine kinase [Bacillota bacterium]PSR28865.1 MAG: sensor histidine kinase [Sulfobacillus benefaciens]
MEYDDRRRYRRLKLLTTIGPTLFVAVAETVRFYYLRRMLPPASVSLVAIAVTLVGAAGFSSYVFDVIEKMENERRTFQNAMLALQERERLAREMHDGLAQTLAVINLKVYQAKTLLEGHRLDELRRELDDIRSAVNKSYSEVRQSLYDLRAGKRLEEGFWTAVRTLAMDFQEGTKVDVEVAPLPNDAVPWNEMASVQILRIIQESLANVRKHAEAKHVQITAAFLDEVVQLKVIDDGKGFVMGSGPLNHHFGLGIMQERAQTFGGRVSIQSEPGVGTVVTITCQVDGDKGGDVVGKSKSYVSG